jgi:hypothetical protein
VGHRVDILHLQNTGPTDGVEDDTLWVADVRDAGTAVDEQVRFSLATSYGELTENEMRELIRKYMAGLSLEDVRAREEPFGEDPYRRVIILRPEP